MVPWTAFSHCGDYPFDAARVKKHWGQLHAGDLETLPKDGAVLDAWALFHSGEFEKAADAGLQAGPAGNNVANKATSVYAHYLEPREKNRQRLFLQVAERAAELAAAEPDNANAYYWQAYALGRYSQGISVAKALAQGVGGKVKSALESAIRLQPKHADAHVALAAFHAEVIDKVGTLIANMTYGAKKETSLNLFTQALSLNPHSAIAKIEYANALVILEGDKRMAEATQYYEQAAAMKALDAAQHLDVEMAQTELAS
jgi:tetratricopeptide (TPR) repeat protein